MPMTAPPCDRLLCHSCIDNQQQDIKENKIFLELFSLIIDNYYLHENGDGFAASIDYETRSYGLPSHKSVNIMDIDPWIYCPGC